MQMRSTLWAVLLLGVLSRPGGDVRAQQGGSDQRPAYRSGVELVSVEVGVVGKDGRPVRGLGPADFTVTVGGQPRRVVTAEFIDAGAQPDPKKLLDTVPISTNEGGGVGRLFVFVVDSNTLETGDAHQVARDASRLISRLTFSDRSALVPLPVGRTIAFTWAHDRVREALVRAATSGGSGAATTSWEFGSLTEARDIATRGSFALREVAARECSNSIFASRGGTGMDPPRAPSTPSPGQSPPSGDTPQGGSGGGSQGGSSGGQPSGGSLGSGVSGELVQDRCLREIQSEAEMAWSMARANSLASLAALRQLLLTLGRVQGDKTVVLFSGGWPLDEHDQTSTITSLAADAAAARVNLYTIFIPRSPMSASRRSISPTLANDRTLYLWPLENLASMSGGRSFRADAGAEGIFDRLAGELAGYYRIAVEKNASDVGANRRPMKVSVARTGTMVRARGFFDEVTYDDRDWSSRLGSALESPVPATTIGLRLTSYLAADPDDAATLRLVLTGDASRFQPGEATLRLVVRDLEGRLIVAGDQQIGELTPDAARFATHVRVPPGSYMVRLAIQDSAGRVGSVDHRVEARPVSLGTISVTGPMLVQVSATGQGNPHLTLEGLRRDERLAVEVGLEGDSAQLASADVTFEIAASPDGPALIQNPASLAQGRRNTSMLAQAVADVRVLPPGQYLARVKVKAGDELLGEVRRPFTVFEPPALAEGEETGTVVAPPTGPTLAAASIRGRAVAALPPFTVKHVLSHDVLDAFLDRVSARPDAAFPGASDLLERARAADIAELKVSDAQAAQTPIAAFVQGLTLLAQNKLNPAASSFRAAMRASPDFYPAMVYLGACYAAAGNDKEAAAVWRTALIKEGGAPAVHLLLSDALLRQGNGGLALQAVDAARARWPDDDGLKRRFVLAALLAGNFAAGLETLDELVARGAEDEPSVALALLVLYDSLTSGRTIEGTDQDRARMMHLADAYRARGGPSLALVETWAAAVSRKQTRDPK